MLNTCVSFFRDHYKKFAGAGFCATMTGVIADLVIYGYEVNTSNPLTDDDNPTDWSSWSTAGYAAGGTLAGIGLIMLFSAVTCGTRPVAAPALLPVAVVGAPQAEMNEFRKR